MHPAFQYDQYLLKRQVLALTGKLRFYNPQEELVLYCEQRMFRIRDELHVYSDEQKSQEILDIKSRQIIEFSAAFDVVDITKNEKVGVLRRKGFRSLLRDEWELLDGEGRLIGMLIEDDLTRALLRRFLLGTFLPQSYDLMANNQMVGVLRQRFNLFGYILELDFGKDQARKLDRRLGIAAGILLAIVEGKQHEE